MKVLHCISSLDKSGGGPVRSVPTLCVGLSKVGVQCEVLAYNSRNPNVEELKVNGIMCRLQKQPTSFREKILCNEFVEGVNFGNNMIVHIQNLWSLCLHRMIKECRRYDIKYLISPRGTLEPWSLRQKKLKKEVAMLMYQREDLIKAACIHATAISEMEHIRNLGFRNPIAVIPNGINIEKYPLKPYDITKKGKRTLLFLSRIHPKKGLDLLFKAWEELPHALTENWQIHIVGEGDNSYSISDLKTMLERDFPDLDVKVLGPQYGEDKIKCYHSADLFILPTHSENFGMVIAEAMCCGLPVITTNGTPWQELREKGVGWYTDVSVNAIKEALSDALCRTSEDLRDRGLRSRKIILQEYSIESIVGKFKLLYQWINGTWERPDFVNIV